MRAAPSHTGIVRARQTPSETGSDWQRRAEASFRTHHYEDAIRYGDRAAAEMPQNGKLFLFLSQAHLAVGDYRAAAGAARQGLSLLEPRDWGYMVENFRSFYHDADYVGQMRRLERTIEDDSRSAARRNRACAARQPPHRVRHRSERRREACPA